MTTSDSINELAAALAKAQAEMGGALKTAANPFFKSKYADLSSVWDACREPLTKYGLSVLQSPTAQGSSVSVETLLMHTSGQWIRDSVTVTAKDDSPQAVGSAITYARRYSLQSFAGVAPEDDDAEAAQGRGNGSKMPPMAQAALPVKPAGYDAWVATLTKKVEDGFDGLSAFYKVRSAEADAYRAYLTATEPQRIEGLKAAAKAVDDVKRAKAMKVPA
jgi:hypothetical protein